MLRPQNQPQIQNQPDGKNMQQYLQELDTLLKRNTGQGLFTGEDTSSNTPMYLPGQVVNPGGVESNASAISAMKPTQQSVVPDFQMPEYGQEEQQQQGEGQQPLNS